MHDVVVVDGEDQGQVHTWSILVYVYAIAIVHGPYGPWSMLQALPIVGRQYATRGTSLYYSYVEGYVVDLENRPNLRV